MATAARKQDMPPPGGFKPLKYARIPAKTYFSAPAFIAANIAVSAGALYLYFINHKRHERDLIEMKSSILAITPLLVAERDREFLKQCRRNRDAEEQLMGNVEGWEVGKWKGEPIYKTVPEDTFIRPNAMEYFVHTKEKYYNKFRNFVFWD
ncbi:NADH dehydrogenase [ubiquinone] 1 alpha subcomplex subunit 13 [Halyomorpha halys]|uniref:NADH dehydrogenase [ubiquinone] 1 alpha subcomplex subunit 13 n=1 Tax=Halyomorpha halys TaxID=286706 RepID=UPI0006D51BDE|nr:NADH dehydrogenase [ubiquinone] 1 alpha subcomplex subunit 13 [Halyomorpha halys]